MQPLVVNIVDFIKNSRAEINKGDSSSLKSQRSLDTDSKRISEKLRRHVFNEMPIRLLHFQTDEKSNLTIKLMERSSVYEQLKSQISPRPQESDENLISEYTRYAILSHTWIRTSPGEVTYSNWSSRCNGNDNNDLGFQKLVNFCNSALKEHKITLGWVDTVCINKESSSELDESIRSMYAWYKRASVCIVYLAKSAELSHMKNDPWFTRGWTLQELLAPSTVKFYNRDWKKISKEENDKQDEGIIKEIDTIASISRIELLDDTRASVSRKMEWAANREVTRDEDIAYSLMGVFGVSFSIAYGEGAERAFSRLLREILVSFQGNVMDIFNFAGELSATDPKEVNNSLNSDILPYNPTFYRFRSKNINILLQQPPEPLLMTHLGLKISVILMPALSSSQGIKSDYLHHGDYYGTVKISPVGFYHDIPTIYNLFDKSALSMDGPAKAGQNMHQITFAAISFTSDGDYLWIAKTCFAFALHFYQDAGKVTDFGYKDLIETKEPIVFEIKKVTTNNPASGGTSVANERNMAVYHRLEKNELSKHGMQLISLHL